MKRRNNGSLRSARNFAAHVMQSTFCGFPYRNERLGGVEEVSVELGSRMDEARGLGRQGQNSESGNRPKQVRLGLYCS